MKVVSVCSSIELLAFTVYVQVNNSMIQMLTVRSAENEPEPK